MPTTSKLDAVYRSILITKYFTKGWGKPENLRRLFEFRKVVSNREECFKLVDRDYPVTITKEQKFSDSTVLEGYFITPLEKHLPGIVPKVAQKAFFQVVLPSHWPEKGYKPVCLHLAGTGDHYFWRRRNIMVRPLLREANVGGIILENPFYGLRKPVDQVRSCLNNVSDIFVMGGSLILESLVLFHWCERNGLGPLGVTGLSMGGHMASLAATNWPKPLVLVPCLSWSTASAVFLQGVMAQSINWDLLEDQYLSDGEYREKLSKMVTVVDEAFLAGKKFAQAYSKNMESLKTSEAKLSDTAIKTNSQSSIDITFKELHLAKENGTNNILKTKSSENTVDVKKELFRLLEEKKISLSLYEKLTQNEKFKLEPSDILELNKLNEEKLKEFLYKIKVAHILDSFKGTNPQITPNATLTANQITKNQSEASDQKRKEWNVSDLTTDIFTNLPFVKMLGGKKIDINKTHWRDREALQFMRGIMDECTHLSNFSVPYDTSLIIAVCAQHDAYVPREDVGNLEEIWPGAEVRFVDAGHISAYVLHQSLFRSCIKEAFERSKNKWKDGKHIDS